jgi:hypothetical protein
MLDARSEAVSWGCDLAFTGSGAQSREPPSFAFVWLFKEFPKTASHKGVLPVCFFACREQFVHLNQIQKEKTMKTKTALKAGGNSSCKPQPSCHPSCGGGLDLSLTVILAVGIVLGI